MQSIHIPELQVSFRSSFLKFHLNWTVIQWVNTFLEVPISFTEAKDRTDGIYDGTFQALTGLIVLVLQALL